MKIPPPPKPMEPSEAAVNAWYRSRFNEMRVNVEANAAGVKAAARRVWRKLICRSM